ncbi:MAG TPA: alcohol dehydrogenase catalytic domain-containing protein [Candidatus Methylomirabilis sp.]|nr:alcohol dehydrogenase catalytic domain-containing protein [Candidatus Methylomirabilis sp.]
MKAILARPAGGFGLCEVDSPTIGPGEILLEMRACGLCGTDLAKLAQARNSHTVTLGHELAGVVRVVGRGVTRFSPGDRIMAAHHVPCGDCWACRHGNESMCPQFKATNIDPCGFAEMVRIPRLHVDHVTHALPDEMSFEVASFTEPLACAVRAVQRSRPLRDDRIAVVGGGGMGLLIAQVLAAHGAVPVVLEISEARLALARALGVRLTINPAREDVPTAVAGMTSGVGLDGAILTVMTEAVLSQTQRLLRPGGRINIFAGPSGGPRYPVDLGDLYHRELSIFSTYSSTPGTLTEAFDLLATNRVRVQTLISHRLPLTAFDEGVELQRSGRATKVIFHP